MSDATSAAAPPAGESKKMDPMEILKGPKLFEFAALGSLAFGSMCILLPFVPSLLFLAGECAEYGFMSMYGAVSVSNAVLFLLLGDAANKVLLKYVLVQKGLVLVVIVLGYLLGRFGLIGTVIAGAFDGGVAFGAYLQLGMDEIQGTIVKVQQAALGLVAKYNPQKRA